MRGDDGVAGEGRVVNVPKFHHAINEYQLRLDVQCFLWPVYYIRLYWFIVKRLSARLLILQCVFSVGGCGFDFCPAVGMQFVTL